MLGDIDEEREKRAVPAAQIPGVEGNPHGCAIRFDLGFKGRGRGERIGKTPVPGEVQDQRFPGVLYA